MKNYFFILMSFFSLFVFADENGYMIISDQKIEILDRESAYLECSTKDLISMTINREVNHEKKPSIVTVDAKTSNHNVSKQCLIHINPDGSFRGAITHSNSGAILFKSHDFVRERQDEQFIEVGLNKLRIIYRFTAKEINAEIINKILDVNAIQPELMTGQPRLEPEHADYGALMEYETLEILYEEYDFRKLATSTKFTELEKISALVKAILSEGLGHENRQSLSGKDKYKKTAQYVSELLSLSLKDLVVR